MAIKTPLELVLDKTENEEQLMTERLEKAQAFIQQERQQLQQLQEYSEEYACKIQQQQTGWSAAQMGHYRSFLQQLHTAVNTQKVKVATAEENTSHLRQQLMACRHKISVLSELIVEQKKNLQLEKDKVLQKELDELAIRISNR